ncbi:hypothetical protein GF351_03420, partial [Candidatus Woesearchaeota archaeon]|nr:hypothetical protein [Candidatus Woesearchaeota archaeon]
MLRPPQQNNADLDVITDILTTDTDPEAHVKPGQDEFDEQDTSAHEDAGDPEQTDEAVRQVMDEQLFEEQIGDVEQHEDRIIDAALESGELQDTVFPGKEITFDRAAVPTIFAESKRSAAANELQKQEETAAEPEMQEILN